MLVRPVDHSGCIGHLVVFHLLFTVTVTRTRTIVRIVTQPAVALVVVVEVAVVPEGALSFICCVSLFGNMLLLPSRGASTKRTTRATKK